MAIMFVGMIDMPQNGAINLGDMMKNMLRGQTQKRKMQVPDARKALEREEADRLPDTDGLSLLQTIKAGGCEAIVCMITAYANIENALDRRYNEVVGYPALPINFRAGFRFRLGGE